MNIRMVPRLTANDLLKMPEGDRYELIGGQLRERQSGAWAAYVAGHVLVRIWQSQQDWRRGTILGSGCSYDCFPSGNVLMPKVSFIRFGRLVDDRVPEGHILIAPDWAVEVVSPTDIQYDVDRKVVEYLEVGVKLVWVINPDTRFVLIYRGDGSISGVREGGELDGEAVVPGFRCPVTELFLP